jgi:spore germination cell wall hydrolase CwlJ-like protein
MEFWGSVSLRACMLVLGFLVLLQTARAEDAGDQPEKPQTSSAAVANLEGIALAAQEVAVQSASSTGGAQWSENEARCLAEGMYFEARGESVRGQLAVGRVIMNRVASDAYPNTICGVVYQNDDKPNRCQFSFACDGKEDIITDAAKWEEIEGYAAWLLANHAKPGEEPQLLASLGGSTHYHADYVNPRWAKTLTLTVRIGRHLFYSDPAA